MKLLKVVGVAAGLAAAIGAKKIMNNAVDSFFEPESRFDKICVFAAKAAVTGIVLTAVNDYVDKKIEETEESIDKVKAVNTVIKKEVGESGRLDFAFRDGELVVNGKSVDALCDELMKPETVYFDKRQDADNILRGCQEIVTSNGWISKYTVYRKFSLYPKSDNQHFNLTRKQEEDTRVGWRDLSDAKIEHDSRGYHVVIPDPADTIGGLY